MLGIYNPEIPVQSAAPISVLLDNLAVPSEARIRSICFPRSCSPGTGMRLDGFPGCALAARAAGSLCGCASKETGQELRTGNLAVWARGGGEDSTPQCRQALFRTLRCLPGTRAIWRRPFRSGRGARGCWNGGAGRPPVSPQPW